MLNPNSLLQERRDELIESKIILKKIDDAVPKILGSDCSDHDKAVLLEALYTTKFYHQQRIWEVLNATP